MRRTQHGTLRLNRTGLAALLLLSVGSMLIVLYATARLQLGVERAQGIQSFEAARQSHILANLDAPLAAGAALPTVAGGAAGATRNARTPLVLAPNQALWSDARIAAYEHAQRMDLVPEGVLRIPAVGIEVPVYPGTGEPNLNRGAGRVEWTPPLGSYGNVGVAAHRDGFFRPLKDIEIGDHILVELLDRTLRYEVTGVTIVDPDAVEVLAPTPHASLTLITCYPFYYLGAAPQRFIVQASLTAGALARN